MTPLERALEALNQSAWFDEYIDDIELDPASADAQTITVTTDSITIHGHEKFGDGSTPYASSPDHHWHMNNHPNATSRDGTVTYPADTPDDTVTLPKHIYYEDTREFVAAVETIGALADELSNALNIPVTPTDLPVSNPV